MSPKWPSTTGKRTFDTHKLASLHQAQTLSSRLALGILFYPRQKQNLLRGKKGSALKHPGTLQSPFTLLGGLLFTSLVRQLSSLFSNKLFPRIQWSCFTCDYANIIDTLKGNSNMALNGSFLQTFFLVFVNKSLIGCREPRCWLGLAARETYVIGLLRLEPMTLGTQCAFLFLRNRYTHSLWQRSIQASLCFTVCSLGSQGGTEA